MKKIIFAVFLPVVLMSCTTIGSSTATETFVPIATATNMYTFTSTSTLSLFTTPSLTLTPASTDTPKILNSQNNHWYQVFLSIGKDWPSARDYCVALHAHLVTIESESENEFVYHNLRPGSYGFSWLGLTDSIQEGNWQWVTGEPLAYTNWHSGEPDNCSNGCGGGPPNSEEEDYAIFNYSLHDWSDWDASYIPFVCEWESTK